MRRLTEVDARWRILDETVRAIKAKNCDLSPEELEAEIELAVRQVRGELASHGRAGGEPPRTGDERS